MTSQRPFTNLKLERFRLYCIVGDKPKNHWLLPIGPLMVLNDAQQWMSILSKTCPGDSFTIREVIEVQS